jgi:hypothetical protein
MDSDLTAIWKHWYDGWNPMGVSDQTDGKPESPSPAALNIQKRLFADIEFSKRQQWVITNYVILIDGAIFWLSKALSSPHERLGLSVLAGVAAIFATTLLILIQKDLGSYRSSLQRAHQKWLSKAELETLQTKFYDNPALRGVLFLIALIGVIAIGAVLVIYTTLCQQH